MTTKIQKYNNIMYGLDSFYRLVPFLDLVSPIFFATGSNRPDNAVRRTCFPDFLAI